MSGVVGCSTSSIFSFSCKIPVVFNVKSDSYRNFVSANASFNLSDVGSSLSIEVIEVGIKVGITVVITVGDFVGASVERLDSDAVDQVSANIMQTRKRVMHSLRYEIAKLKCDSLDKVTQKFCGSKLCSNHVIKLALTAVHIVGGCI